MLRVYIAHPIRGNVEQNLEDAALWVRWAALTQNVCPVAPYLTYTRALNEDDPDQRALGIRLGLEHLRACDELWVCGKRISEGMQEEIDQAFRWGIRIHYFTSWEEADEKRVRARRFAGGPL